MPSCETTCPTCPRYLTSFLEKLTGLAPKWLSVIHYRWTVGHKGSFSASCWLISSFHQFIHQTYCVCDHSQFCNYACYHGYICTAIFMNHFTVFCLETLKRNTHCESLSVMYMFIVVSDLLLGMCRAVWAFNKVSVGILTWEEVKIAQDVLWIRSCTVPYIMYIAVWHYPWEEQVVIMVIICTIKFSGPVYLQGIRTSLVLLSNAGWRDHLSSSYFYLSGAVRQSLTFLYAAYNKSFEAHMFVPVTAYLFSTQWVTGSFVNQVQWINMINKKLSSYIYISIRSKVWPHKNTYQYLLFF